MYTLIVLTILSLFSLPSAADSLILASGQSNISRHHAFNWVPPPNLTVWDLHRINTNLGSTDQDLGNAFVPWDGTEITLSVAYAAEVAARNPNEQIRLISIAWGGKSIDHWIGTQTQPDLYYMVRNNVREALKQLPSGAKVDEFLWWQGESDSNPYFARYLAMEQRFRAENIWFYHQTKILLITPNPSGNGGFKRFNGIAQSLFVASLFAPQIRTTFVPSTYEFDDGIHLNPEEFYDFSRDLRDVVEFRFYNG